MISALRQKPIPLESESEEFAMKKVFEAPEINVFDMQAEDVLTLSFDLTELAKLDENQMTDWHRLG